VTDVLPTLAAGEGESVLCTVTEAWKGCLYRYFSQGLLSCEFLSILAAEDSIYTQNTVIPKINDTYMQIL
jgi:hypothetical protein